MNKSITKNWLTWLGLVALTLMLVGIAYFIFRPIAAVESIPPDVIENSESPPIRLTLSEALPTLENSHQVSMTLDNPFLEDCPFPEAIFNEKSFKKVLQLLTRHYKIEIHEAAPGEYLLIGGKCK